MGDPFKDYLMENPILILVVLYIGYKFVKLSFEVPEVEGSKVVKVRDMQEWIDILRVSEKNEQLVVLLFFKNRNFACRKVAPIFGEMSKRYDEVDVLFVKCNVDFNWEIKTSYKIDEEVISLPYVKIFEGPEAVEYLEFDEAKVTELLKQYGAKQLTMADQKKVK